MAADQSATSHPAPSEAPPRQPSPPGIVRTAVWLGFAVGFINMGHRVGFGVLYPWMAVDQGWTASEVTGAFSVAMLIYSPAVVLSGFLIDRVGVRAIMLAGTAFFGLGLAAVGQVQSLWQLYLVYCGLIAFGNASIGFVPTLKLLSLRAHARLGFALGMFNVGQGVGALLASPLLQLIVDFGGWRAGFLAIGVTTVALLGPLIALGAPGRGEQVPSPASRADEPIGQIWRQPVFWVVFCVNSSLGYLLLLPAHHVAHLNLVGIPSLLAATAGGLFGACIGLAALLGGWAIDRWGPARLDLPAAGVMTVGVAALIFSSPDLLWLVVVYILAGGLGRGALGVSAAVLQARAFAGPQMGRVTGLLDLGFGVGAFAGPYLVALSRDLTGSYGYGLATAALAGIVAAVGARLARSLSGLDSTSRTR